MLQKIQAKALPLWEAAGQRSLLISQSREEHMARKISEHLRTAEKAGRNCVVHLGAAHLPRVMLELLRASQDLSDLSWVILWPGVSEKPVPQFLRELPQLIRSMSSGRR